MWFYIWALKNMIQNQYLCSFWYWAERNAHPSSKWDCKYGKFDIENGRTMKLNGKHQCRCIDGNGSKTIALKPHIWLILW